MPYRVLHLSDPHFGDDHRFAQDGLPPGVRRLAEAIRQSLTSAGQATDFDAVVLSGDIYTTVAQPERVKARIELLELKESLPAPYWAVVPGNHDLTWEPEQKDDRFVYFNNLVGELWPGAAVPRDMPSLVVVPSKDGLKPLALVCLDSCRLEGPVQRGLGYFGDTQLDLIPERLTANGVSKETHTLVAVLHHHLIAVSDIPDLPRPPKPEDEGKSEERVITSVTLDASRTLRALAEAGVSLVLLGHQHTPKVLTHYDFDWGDRSPLYVAAAGSCGIAAPDLLRHFYVWEIDDNHATAFHLRQPPGDAFAFELLTNSPVLEF